VYSRKNIKPEYVDIYVLVANRIYLQQTATDYNHSRIKLLQFLPGFPLTDHFDTFIILQVLFSGFRSKLVCIAKTACYITIKQNTNARMLMDN